MCTICLRYREKLQGLSFFIESDGKVVTQPIPVAEVVSKLEGEKTSSGEKFLVVPETDTGNTVFTKGISLRLQH